MKKIILAFSGGLDTSFCVPYLKEKGCEVITVAVDTGGFTHSALKKIHEKALELGATKHYEIDAKEDLFNNFASYFIKANYLKGGVYPACVGPERNIIAIILAAIAEKEKTKIVAHGSTGAGNDQVRFDLALRALMPGVEIITPIRDEGLTRDEEVKFLKQHGYKVEEKSKEYSINVGLLGTTIGGKETKGTEKEIPDDVFPNVKSIQKAKPHPDIIKIHFKNGLPDCLDGKKMSGVKIIQTLNKIGAENGFGKDYHIGTTIIGIKGRIAFESPGMKILIKAHSELEKTILTSKQLFWKNTLGTLYGDLIHEGLYFDPIVKDIEAFLDSSNQNFDGDVEIKIHKGNVIISSMKSKYSLLNAELGTYGEKTGGWNGLEARAFCKLYGLESVNAYHVLKKGKGS